MSSELILSIISIALSGGLIKTLLTIRTLKKKEKYEADKLKEEVDSNSIKNANDVINLYKRALEDVKNLNESKELELNRKIKEQDKKLADYSKKINDQNSIIANQNKLLNEMKRNQIKLQLDVENLKKQSLENCELCAFAESCLKKSAKEQSTTK